MGRSLLKTLGLALSLAAVSCSQPTEWSATQRAAFREAVKAYREMVYLENLDDTEFVIFSNDLASDVEQVYPVYTQFVAMPAINDTLEVWVVTAIVDELDENAHNMRHIYPYEGLVADGVLPADLSSEQKFLFYDCFAQKVNTTFSGLTPFVNAMLDNEVEPNIITKMQSGCANDLFDWEVSEVVAIEEYE